VATKGSQPQPAGQGHDGQADCGAMTDSAGGDGSVALAGMLAVGFTVQQVVDDVAGRPAASPAEKARKSGDS